MRTRILLAAAAIALFALAYWLGRESGAPKSALLASGATPTEESQSIDESMVAPETDGSATTDRVTVQTAAQSTPKSSATVAPQNLPLPALDAPLATIIDDLRKRADKGDARAACRLAAELRKCESQDAQLLFAERLNSNPGMGRRGPRGDDRDNPEGRARMEQFVNRLSDRALATSEHCAGVPQASPNEQFRYWRQAALQGHIPSMAIYGTGEIFQQRNALSQLEDLRLYKQEAESMARRAALAGDIEATLSLSRAYSPQQDQMRPSLLAQATGPNIVEELSMLLLAQRRGVTAMPQFGRGPRSDQERHTIEDAILAVRARAAPEEILRAEQQANVRDSANPVSANSLPYQNDRSRWFDDDQERRMCDTDAFTTVAPPRASG